MDEVRLAGASVRILPVIRGLPSEATTVADAIESVAPGWIALSLAPEEVEALRAWDGKPFAPENFEEEVYVAGLSKWETPLKPPPCFTESVRIAEERRLRLDALDLDDEAYADAYVACVSTFELILQSRAQRRLRRKRFDATSPREFVLEWDAEVNRSAGFRRLQKRREEHMAERLRRLATEGARILAIIEVERAAGVLAALRA